MYNKKIDNNKKLVLNEEQEDAIRKQKNQWMKIDMKNF